MKKFYYILPIIFFSFLLAQDESEDINLDDLWDTTVWEEIEEINEVEGEVEQVVTVAGAVSYTHLSCRRIERCRSRWSPYH